MFPTIVDQNSSVFIRADLSGMLAELSVSDRRAPGCEKKSLEMAVQQNLGTFDYEQKKMLAAKVMQTKPANTEYRVPTSAWSGYGLSQSIPPISTTDLSKVSKRFPRVQTSFRRSFLSDSFRRN